MITQIILNTTPISVENFSHSTVFNERYQDLLRVVKVDFKVTSNDYHDMTTLLYQNNFNLIIPGKNIEFPCHIQNYHTSITNLYQEGQVGTFHLELIETKEE